MDGGGVNGAIQVGVGQVGQVGYGRSLINIGQSVRKYQLLCMFVRTWYCSDLVYYHRTFF